MEGGGMNGGWCRLVEPILRGHRLGLAGDLGQGGKDDLAVAWVNAVQPVIVIAEQLVWLAAEQPPAGGAHQSDLGGGGCAVFAKRADLRRVDHNGDVADNLPVVSLV